MKKHSFTLLEVIIALILLGIVLTFLFSFFQQTLVSKMRNSTLREKVLQVNLFKLRLDQLFERFTQGSNCQIFSMPHPDAVGPAMLFYYDNGVQPDFCFSGSIYSMLFETRDHRLCLCSWSKNQKAKVDTLLPHVQDFHFTFFADKKWHSVWPEKNQENSLPLMMNLSLLLPGEKNRCEFFFSFPKEGS